MSDHDGDYDPLLKGYKPLKFFRKTDMDHSSRRIRDMPWGRRRYHGVLEPDHLDFESFRLNSLSNEKYVIIFNQGYDKLRIRDIVVVGDFVVTHDVSKFIKPNEYSLIQVQFLPRRLGELTGGLYVDMGNAIGPRFVKLTGIGTHI